MRAAGVAGMLERERISAPSPRLLSDKAVTSHRSPRQTSRATADKSASAQSGDESPQSKALHGLQPETRHVGRQPPGA